MPIYTAKRGAVSYGHSVGMLMIDCHIPFIPGDIGNAQTFKYPILYRKVESASIERLIDHGDMSISPQVIEAAKYLESQGVRAITSDCGFMIYFQQAVASAVNVPVMLSSLMQLTFISSLLAPSQAIGIICANAKRLTPELIAKAFPANDRTLIVAGMQDQPAFRSSILLESGDLDSEAVERELVNVGTKLVETNPSIGAILLECSDLPPYAKALQDRINLPVFDFTTMIDFVHAATSRRRFEGTL
ncbi:aspartate/glutamate racemase family protein [Microvirga sp. TS319]|uniref:aspartate/glutamate racemase family protein n=1 Tax=Microvirga sp. TS319 TaxID=3241165 RepID=UPI00351A07AE